MCKSTCSVEEAIDVLIRNSDEKRRVTVTRHGNSGRVYVPASLVGRVVDKYVIRGRKKTIVLIVADEQ